MGIIKQHMLEEYEKNYKEPTLEELFWESMEKED